MKLNLLTILCFAVLLVANAESDDTNDLFYPAGTDFNYKDYTNGLSQQLTNMPPNVPPLSEASLRNQMERGVRDAKAKVVLNEQIRTAALKAGECYPEDKDLNGNWGPPRWGCRLSIRSQTNTYALGDTIPVKVIIRNITNEMLNAFNMSENMQIGFVFEDETGKSIARNCKLGENAGGSIYGFIELPPKRQLKYEYDLKDWHNYKPGIYKIQAEQVIFKEGLGVTNIDSGQLVLRIKN